MTLSVVAAAFAGCLNADSQKGPALISRVHTVTIDGSTEDVVDRHGDDVEAIIRELLRTTLVVRVEEAGDYTLEYLDQNGNPKTETLTGLQAGVPRDVPGADPLAPATLKRGSDVVVSRIGAIGEWWHVGDIPLGFNMTDGAAATYDFTSRVEESFTLTDLDLEEQQGVKVESINFQLRLPIDGEMSYELGASAGAEGSPLTLTGSVEIPPNAGDLVTAEIRATMEGQPGTAGIIAGVDEARASGSVRTWWVDGQPVAAQFLGGEYSADPRVNIWAEGAAADQMGDQPCAGASKEDKCEPENLETYSGSEEAGEKEEFPADDYPVLSDADLSEDDREMMQKTIDVLRQVFALDIVRGDKLTLTAQFDEDDFASGDPSAPEMSFRTDFAIEAVEVETVSVPAGSFEALKITEEVKTAMRIANVRDPGTDETLFNDFTMDETVARATYWLEVGTNRPVKMEATTPVDIDALAKRVMNSVAPAGWQQAQLDGKPLDDNDWRITMSAESGYEATRLTGATHYSALVGLALAHGVTSSASFPMMWAMTAAGAGMGPMFGSPMMSDDAMYYGGEDYPSPVYSEDYPYPAPTPDGSWHTDPVPVTLALSSSGPAMDGIFSYVVTDGTGSWADVMLTVDGEQFYSSYSDTGDCPMPMEGEFALCRDGAALYGFEEILAGDSISIPATAGASLRFVDYNTGGVVLSMTA